MRIRIDDPNVTVGQLMRTWQTSLHPELSPDWENSRVLGPSGLQQPSESTVNTNPSGKST